MNRVQAADTKYYLGSVSHSMERLPKWYQIFALSGILFVIYLRHNPIISWLVVNLHSSFGTEFIWYSEYEHLLGQMSFNERLCFTLYGVALAAIVVALYKLFCRDAHGFGWSATQIFPDRKGASIGMLGLLCLMETVRMRSFIAQCLSDPTSPANRVIGTFSGLEGTEKDPSLASRNPHFVVQAELLKALIKNIVFVRIPLMAAAGAFRLFRDIPRRTHAALRWYLATASVLLSLKELCAMYLNQSYDDPASWAVIAWTAVLLGAINFVYGPSKRAGLVVTATTANCFTETLRGMTTSTALWCLSSMLVLTVIVSVHVVELISLWLIISLLILWSPAIIDSCSTDYVTLLSGGFAWLGKSMGYLTLRGSVRFGLLLATWWFTACLVYNITTYVTRNRYAGMLIVAWLFFWIVSPTAKDAEAATTADTTAAEAVVTSVEESEDEMYGGDKDSSGNALDDMPVRRTDVKGGAFSVRSQHLEHVAEEAAEQAQDAISFLSERLSWLCRVADYDAVVLQSSSPSVLSLRQTAAAARPVTSSHEEDSIIAGRELFTSTFETAILLSASILLLNYMYSLRVSSDVRVKMRRRNLMLATPIVVCRKAVRTVVLVFCVVSFLLSTLIFREYVLPHMVRFLPGFVLQGISVGVGCIVLGVLMDTKESMYDAVARALGLADPPATNDDGSPAFDSTSQRGNGADFDDDLEEELE